MKHDLASLIQALYAAPALALRARLTRRVEYLTLANSSPPNWLYTSAKAKRYNPAGVHCVYFALDASVARSEYAQIWRGLSGGDQPATEFNAEVNLRRVLDLTSPDTLKALRIDTADLLKNWRRARHPTLTQLVGQAVNETRCFSAIRYQSAVSKGANIVVFRDCVRSPDYVKILGPTRKPLGQWP